MIKSFYLVYSTMNLDNPDGVEKKIVSQKKAFSVRGFNMSFYTLKKKNGTFWANPEELNGADFIYFRRGTIIDVRFLRFFKRIKKTNPKCVIFMEIPTYPYDNESNYSIARRGALLIDRICRRYIHKYIDRLVVVNYHKATLWNIKTINLINGIDVDAIKPKSFLNSGDVSSVRICCVARFSPWHGYERLIKGLKEYYKQQPLKAVYISMIGSGNEAEFYKKLVEELELTEYVEFKGQMVGEELDLEYDKADIGCCSLGRYKSGLEMTSELKSRELMAKGLPMICGCKIDVLEETEYPFKIMVPNDNSNINIHKVIKAYEEMILLYGKENMSRNIREYAKKMVDMSVTFSPIIDEAQALCLN